MLLRTESAHKKRAVSVCAWGLGGRGVSILFFSKETYVELVGVSIATRCAASFHPPTPHAQAGERNG